MLNQVPRTLLNIGIDPVERETEETATPLRHGDGGGASPPFDWESFTLGVVGEGDTKTGEGGLSPRSTRTEGRKGGGKGPLRSTFTNESIADQALKDFGDGAVS